MAPSTCPEPERRPSRAALSRSSPSGDSSLATAPASGAWVRATTSSPRSTATSTAPSGASSTRTPRRSFGPSATSGVVKQIVVRAATSPQPEPAELRGVHGGAEGDAGVDLVLERHRVAALRGERLDHAPHHHRDARRAAHQHHVIDVADPDRRRLAAPLEGALGASDRALHELGDDRLVVGAADVGLERDRSRPSDRRRSPPSTRAPPRRWRGSP